MFDFMIFFIGIASNIKRDISVGDSRDNEVEMVYYDESKDGDIIINRKVKINAAQENDLITLKEYVEQHFHRWHKLKIK